MNRASLRIFLLLPLSRQTLSRQDKRIPIEVFPEVLLVSVELRFTQTLETLFFTRHAAFSLRAKVFNKLTLLAVLFEHRVSFFYLFEALLEFFKPQVFERKQSKKLD